MKKRLPLVSRLATNPVRSVTAFNLGHAYKDIPALRDLAQAERWYRRSLELFDERDRNGRARCVGQLGYVAWERFKEARDANGAGRGGVTPPLQHLNDAVRYYLQALELLPPNAVDDLAVAHNQLGKSTTRQATLTARCRTTARQFATDELGGNCTKRQVRRNVALALAQAGRLEDALEYARAALRNFETFGDRAAEEIEKTRRLVEWIESMKDEG
jgi:tetratricopeptide (TPR) repeat protein